MSEIHAPRIEGRYVAHEKTPVSDQNEKMLKQMIGLIDKDLKVEDYPIVNVLEEEFVGTFLPLFCGEETNVNYTHWVGRIGGYFKTANVIDRAGNLLFVVPPIYDQEANEGLIVKSREFEVGSAMMHLETEGRVNPHAATQHRNEILQLHAEHMQKRKDIWKYASEWNEIYKRYKKPLIEFKEAARVTQPSNLPPPTADDYDIA